MDEFVCPYCGSDLLESGETDMDSHLERCEAYLRTLDPEKYNQESPLCDGDED